MAKIEAIKEKIKQIRGNKELSVVNKNEVTLNKNIDVLVKDAFLVFLENFQDDFPRNYSKIKAVITDFVSISIDFIRNDREKTMNIIIHQFLFAFIAFYFKDKEKESKDFNSKFDELYNSLLDIMKNYDSNIAEIDSLIVKHNIIDPTTIKDDKTDGSNGEEDEEL